tara:strand:- start:198 stop:482 length:285 start_codon:yes stop_codon:yes gene_type:complete
MSPHFPPSKNRSSTFINEKDICFYHYKVNKNSKRAIENHGKQKMKYSEDKSMAEKAYYLKDYNFIEKPQTKQNFIDSKQDILGLDSLKWNEVYD